MIQNYIILVHGQCILIFKLLITLLKSIEVKKNLFIQT